MGIYVCMYVCMYVFMYKGMNIFTVFVQNSLYGDLRVCERMHFVRMLYSRMLDRKSDTVNAARVHYDAHHT